jgi:hypothetical protein
MCRIADPSSYPKMLTFRKSVVFILRHGRLLDVGKNKMGKEKHQNKAARAL